MQIGSIQFFLAARIYMLNVFSGTWPLDWLELRCIHPLRGWLRAEERRKEGMRQEIIHALPSVVPPDLRTSGWHSGRMDREGWDGLSIIHGWFMEEAAVAAASPMQSRKISIAPPTRTILRRAWCKMPKSSKYDEICQEWWVLLKIQTCKTCRSSDSAGGKNCVPEDAYKAASINNVRSALRVFRGLVQKQKCTVRVWIQYCILDRKLDNRVPKSRKGCGYHLWMVPNRTYMNRKGRGRRRVRRFFCVSHARDVSEDGRADKVAVRARRPVGCHRRGPRAWRAPPRARPRPRAPRPRDLIQ